MAGVLTKFFRGLSLWQLRCVRLANLWVDTAKKGVKFWVPGIALELLAVKVSFTVMRAEAARLFERGQAGDGGSLASDGGKEKGGSSVE